MRYHVEAARWGVCRGRDCGSMGREAEEERLICSEFKVSGGEGYGHSDMTLCP